MDADRHQASSDSDVAPNLPSLNPTNEIPEEFGDYEVDRLIARGTHGDVFKGTDTHGLRVAVKWLRQRQSDSELDALIQMSKSVNGLPPILGSGVKDDRTYFVMPYYERRSLRFRLRRLPFPQPLGEVVRLAEAITEVLGELHRHGYTHADFKPDNVLLDCLPAASDRSEHVLLRDDERLVLTDFGTIRSSDGAVQFGEGTLGYAAPELLTTIVDHDPRVDVYAASATLVECITGVVPTQVRAPGESAFNDEVLRSIGPLEPVLRRGLAFDPQGRYETILTWFDAIVAVADGRPTQPPGTERQPRPQVPGDRLPPQTKPKKEALAAVALLGLVLAGYWVITQSRATPSLIAQPGTEVESTPAAPAATPQADTGRRVTPESVSASPTLLDLAPDSRWGTPRRQLTSVYSGPDQPPQSDGARYHNIEVTSRTLISQNEQWILAKRDGDWTVVDRSSGAFRRVDLEPGAQPTWHPTEPATILHLDSLALLATPVDGETTVAADLRDRLVAQLPEAAYLLAPGQGEPSADGSRFAWAVADQASRTIGFVTYDLPADTVLAVQVEVPSGDLGQFNSIAMAKSGEIVVLAFEQAFVIYDVDFTNERRIDQRPFSYELALTSTLHDVAVVANFDSDTFGAGWIVTHDLVTGASSRLIDLYDGSNADVELSGLATEKPGWVLVSTHDCAIQDSLSCDRLMALNVDDATIVNLAQTESCAANSFTVPTGVVNRDFTKAWFNTDFGSCGEDATIVELDIEQFDQ